MRPDPVVRTHLYFLHIIRIVQERLHHFKDHGGVVGIVRVDQVLDKRRVALIGRNVKHQLQQDGQHVVLFFRIGIDHLEVDQTAVAFAVHQFTEIELGQVIADGLAFLVGENETGLLLNQLEDEGEVEMIQIDLEQTAERQLPADRLAGRLKQAVHRRQQVLCACAEAVGVDEVDQFRQQGQHFLRRSVLIEQFIHAGEDLDQDIGERFVKVELAVFIVRQRDVRINTERVEDRRKTVFVSFAAVNDQRGGLAVLQMCEEAVRAAEEQPFQNAVRGA